MLNHPTLTQLDALGFAGMATAFKELAAMGEEPLALGAFRLDIVSTPDG